MEKCDAGFSVKFSTIWLAFSKSNYSGRFCWVLSVPRAQGAFVGGKFRFDTEEAMAAETRLTELDLHSAPAVLRSFHQLETDVRRALTPQRGWTLGHSSSADCRMVSASKASFACPATTLMSAVLFAKLKVWARW